MKGEFTKRKIGVFDIFSAVGGIGAIAFYVFLKITAPDDAEELLIFLILGIILLLISVLLFLLNSNGYIFVDNDFLKARYSFFWKVDCKLSDVSFALAQGNSLTVQLKNGDTHTIANVINARQLVSFIRKNITEKETEQPRALIEKLNELKSARKKDLIYTICGCTSMFLNIFITVFLTSDKEMNEFGKTDWIIFSVFIAIELVTMVIVFYFAMKAGRKIVPMEKMQYAIRKRTIETAPLLPGKAIRVFTDEDRTGRITVFGYPNDNHVYYVVQTLNSDYSFVTAFESEIYEDVSELPEDFYLLIDITNELSFDRK